MSSSSAVRRLELSHLGFQLANERGAVFLVVSRFRPQRLARRRAVGRVRREGFPQGGQERVRLGRLDDEPVSAQAEGERFILGIGMGSCIEDEEDVLKARIFSPGAAQSAAILTGIRMLLMIRSGGAPHANASVPLEARSSVYPLADSSTCRRYKFGGSSSMISILVMANFLWSMTHFSALG